MGAAGLLNPKMPLCEASLGPLTPRHRPFESTSISTLPAHRIHSHLHTRFTAPHFMASRGFASHLLISFCQIGDMPCARSFHRHRDQNYMHSAVVLYDIIDDFPLAWLDLTHCFVIQFAHGAIFQIFHAFHCLVQHPMPFAAAGAWRPLKSHQPTWSSSIPSTFCTHTKRIHTFSCRLTHLVLL